MFGLIESHAGLQTHTAKHPCSVAFLLLLISGCADKPREVLEHRASEPPQAESSPDHPVRPTLSSIGKVVAVKDGDTIVVLQGREQVTVRLVGIDCPESTQPFGAKAKQAASDLCFGQQVTIKVTGKDRYSRSLAEVILPDGRTLNRELVRTGFAWWFREYSADENLGELEAEARANKWGLWDDAKSIAPWDWRADQKTEPETPPKEMEIVPSGVAIVALLPNPEGEDTGNEQVTIGNSTGKRVELSGWRLLDLAGHVFLLSGRVEPRKELVVPMTDETMPLDNDGDSVILVDAKGVGRSRVSYEGSQVRSGMIVRFGR